MIKEVEKDKTLLVKGPTRVNLIEGKVEVFGKIITPEEDVPEKEEEQNNDGLIVPSATMYPFYALEDSKFEIYSSNAEKSLKIIENNSIPEEWEDAKDTCIKIIKKSDEPISIMVMGLSSGKTTLVKYLANNFLKEGYNGAYLDSDLGQQFMFLPTTINIGRIEKTIIFSEDIEPERTQFLGSTFPKGTLKYIVSHSCKALIRRYKEKYEETNFIVIDTDSYIKTEAGMVYKNFFIETVDPDVLIVLHDDEVEELKEIEKEAKSKNRKIIIIKEDNEYFLEKSKEDRRFLRQSQFAKVLEEFRKITIPLDEIEFIKYDYDKENDELFEKRVIEEELVKLPYHYVIVALLDEDDELIKIALLFSINIEKDYILLFSDLTYKEQIRIKKVLLGSLRLSTKGNHQGYLYL
ncbi:MAG: hypothetical protein GF317_10615 [Candidatus Lokiarchaeota archaeon]|nr:hypothetical protein [Candidatus Lokiarchaeota archaeon]MBD3200113.1 hypothetical protein [Candidatus Lokiarchaeota archaeon]